MATLRLASPLERKIEQLPKKKAKKRIFIGPLLQRGFQPAASGPQGLEGRGLRNQSGQLMAKKKRGKGEYKGLSFVHEQRIEDTSTEQLIQSLRLQQRLLDDIYRVCITR
jgi:hypothetical protein